MLRRCAVVVLLAVAVPVALAPTGSADVPSYGRDLPGLSGNDPTITEMVIDSVHDQLIMSGPGGIDVATPTPMGAADARHVPSPAAVGGLALGDNDATLWYSSITDGTLVSTDTADLANATRVTHAVPDSQCPTKLVIDSTGRIWFLYRPCASGSDPGGLGVYDPATDQFDLAPAVDAQIADLGDLDVLENNPSAADTLVVASDTHTSSIDVATGSVQADTAHPDGARGVAVTSDGSRYVRANTDVTSAPVDDPGSTTGTTTYDSSSMNETAQARGVTLTADDRYLAAAFGSDIISFGAGQGDRSWVRRCETVRGDVEAMVWDGSTVWLLQDRVVTLSLEPCTNMTTPQSFIAATDLSKPAGSTFSNTVTLAYHDQPVAGATLTVQRSTNSGTTNLPDLVTDSLGRATLQGIANRGGTNYMVQWAGDGTRLGTWSSFGVAGTTQQTRLTVTRGDRRGHADQPLTIRDRLVAADGSGLGRRAIHVVRLDATGSHVLPDVITDSTGRFALTTAPRFGRITWYHLSFLGEPAYLKSATASFRVDVDRLRPTLSIALQKSAIWYNQKAVVRIHLGRTYQCRTVILFAVPAGGGLHRVFTGPVGRDGNVTQRVAMNRNTKFIAWFKGDARYNARRVSITELSGLLPSLSLGGGYGTSGKYRLYRSDQSITLTGKLLPAQPGRCLRFIAFHGKDGKWVEDGYSPCVPTNRKGVGTTTFHPPNPKLNAPYLLEAFFKGDKLHCWSRSAARYATFTAVSGRSRASAQTRQKGYWTIGR